MNDTKQRIAEYTERLPKIKEKFVAMIALLVIAASMLTTVSFAWLALSTNPEVTGITTAVAANGNLEVALANGTLTAPGATQLGDGSLGILEKNLTWGNLINLSDPSYGLSNMVLRPALLNLGGLDTNPLRAAVYSGDGRFDSLSTNFGFAKWMDYTDGRQGGEFTLTNEYGLRAITSTKFTVDMGPFDAKQSSLATEVYNANYRAKEAYLTIVTTRSYMNTLATLMGSFMTANMNRDDATLSNPTVESGDIENLMYIFRDFIVALKKEQEYMLEAANYQIFLQQIYTPGAESKITLEELFDNVSEATKNDPTTVTTTLSDFNGQNLKVTIYGIGANKRELRIMTEGYEKLVVLSTKGDVAWKDSGIKEILESLVNVGQCTVDGTPVSSIGASNAAGYISGTHSAVINNGVLCNYEDRTGAKMNVEGLSITAQIKRMGMTIPGTVKANITTSADETNCGYLKDEAHEAELLKKAQEKNNSQAPTRMADETYGYVIDFWVRTNAAASLLNLEGNVLTETYFEDAKGKDSNGNEVQLYTVSEKTGEVLAGVEMTESRDVYKMETAVTVTYAADGVTITNIEPNDQGTQVVEQWYYADGHTAYKYFKLKESAEATTGKWYQATANENNTVTYTEVTGVTEPAWKLNEFKRVIGYSGENRVWDDDSTAGNLVTENATTQGSGSCYVFYADTPEDQDRGLALLSHLKVAFADASGNLLAQAYLDTESFYSDSGKIIVPLVLDDTKILQNDEGEAILDKAGEKQRYITELPQNEAMLISAIVYLDGLNIKNENVLSASDIQGQFNIQFGNSIQLQPSTNDDLEMKELVLSATVDKTELDWEKDSNFTVNVTAQINGVQPQRVEAFFVRTITATQGVPLKDVISFTDQGNGTWKASYTFTGPGEYVLRSLRIDGVEYDLDKNNRPKVSISGFSVSSVSWGVGGDFHRFMTSASSVSTDMAVEFNADPNKQPNSVVGMFHEVGGSRTTSVEFKYDTKKWTGTATFATSGEYVLDMLIIDGEYFKVPEELQKTAEVICGMKVAVSSSSPTNFLYGLGEDKDPDTGDNGTGMYENESSLKMRLIIMDNNGTPIEGLSGITLHYGRKSYLASVVGLSFNMRWNATSGYYEGEAPSKPGTFEFIRVDVNGNEIATATTSPTFNIGSPFPPTVADVSVTSTRYQFTVGKEGTLSVPLKDTNDETKCWAVIEKQNADGTWTALEQLVEGTYVGTGNGEYDTWQFKIEESGTYRITKLLFKNVYVNNQMVEEDDEAYPVELNETQSARTQASILTAIEAEVTPTINLGGTSLESATADFMSAQNLPGIVLKLTDGKNAVTAPGATAKLVYQYQFDSAAFGGYFAAAADIDAFKTAYSGIVEVHLKDTDGDGTFDEMVTPVSLTYAGTYKLQSITFPTYYKLLETVATPGIGVEANTNNLILDPTVTNGAYKDLSSVISVYSKKPTVKITGVSPTNTTVNSGDNELSATNAVFNNGFSVVAYITGTKEWALVPYWNYSTPTISLEIQNTSDITSATFTLINATNASYNNVVTFDSTKATTTKVGHVISGTGRDTKYTINKQTISQITVVKNGITFTAILSDMLSFEQPEKPSTLTYAGIPESYTGARPVMVVANGTRFVLTLPTISWTANIEEPVGGEPVYSDYVNPVTLRTDYTEQKSSSWGQTWWKYYLYNWCRYTATAIAEADIYAQEYIISGWSINGTTYAAGEEIVIDSETDIIAIAIVEEGEKTYVDTKETPMYKYKYGYERVGEGDKPTSSDSKKIGDTTTVGTSWSVPQWKEYPPALGPLYDSDAEYEKAWP